MFSVVSKSVVSKNVMCDGLCSSHIGYCPSVVSPIRKGNSSGEKLLTSSIRVNAQTYFDSVIPSRIYIAKNINKSWNFLIFSEAHI